MITFLRAIAANPADEAKRLVFADWLEERGDWRAEFLRLDCQLALETISAAEEAKARWDKLWAKLSPSWQTVLARPPIENCQPSLPEEDYRPRFKFQCPMKWENLQPTEVGAVRFCENCSKSVHYCDSVDAAREHASLGHCVAVNVGVRRFSDDLIPAEDLMLGQVVDGEFHVEANDDGKFGDG